MVDCDAEAAIPEPLRDYQLPEPPADLAVRPYRHVAIVEATEPLPAPAPQTVPPDGWWPHSVHATSSRRGRSTRSPSGCSDARRGTAAAG